MQKNLPGIETVVCHTMWPVQLFFPSFIVFSCKQLPLKDCFLEVFSVVEKDNFHPGIELFFKCVPSSMMPGQLIVILCKYLLRLKSHKPNFKLYTPSRSKSWLLEKIADMSSCTGKLFLNNSLMVFSFWKIWIFPMTLVRFLLLECLVLFFIHKWVKP